MKLSELEDYNKLENRFDRLENKIDAGINRLEARINRIEAIIWVPVAAAVAQIIVAFLK